MSTKTKDKKSKTEKLYFTTTGEFLTNTARHTWVSDLPKKAITILTEGANMTLEQAILIISGKKKLTGKVRIGTSDTLGWEDDNETEMFGIALDVETMVGRLEKKFIDSAESRSVYSESEAGIFDEDLESDAEYKKQRIAHIDEQQKEVLENLEVLYPLVGKSIKNLPINKARSLKQMREEEIKNNPAPEVEEKEVEEVIGSPEWKNSRQGFIDGYLKNLEEKNKPKALTDKRYSGRFYGKGEGVFYYIVPLTIERCKEENIGSGFLLPDGTFYGGKAYPYVHQDILYDLNEETDFFKGKKYTAEEKSVEEAGWAKLSGKHWYFWNHDVELTKEQVQFIIDYTIEVEENDRFAMNGSVIDLKKFAGILDGAKLDTYDMKYRSEENEEAEGMADNRPKTDLFSADELDKFSSCWLLPDGTAFEVPNESHDDHLPKGFKKIETAENKCVRMSFSWGWDAPISKMQINGEPTIEQVAIIKHLVENKIITLEKIKIWSDTNALDELFKDNK